MAEPKISVCIPVYNYEKYLGEAVESVLQQTFTDFELIVVDNHSTDKTPQIAEKYAKQDKRIILHRNETNLGMISNWNLSILLARGEYMKMLCADDKLMPRCLEVFADILNKNPQISLVTSFSKCIGDEDTIKDEKWVYATGEINGKELQKNLFLMWNWIGSPTTVMFRRKDLHIGLFNQAWNRYLPDRDFWIRLLSIGNAYVVPEILCLHRTHNESFTATCNPNFDCIKERLQFACFAFQFPHMYGEFTKKEQRQLYRHLLERLVREGYGKRGIKAKIDMLKIGLFENHRNRFVFLLLLLKNFRRLFKKHSRWSD